MSEKEEEFEAFNVEVWFKGGESRVFGATQTRVVSGYLFIEGYQRDSFVFNLSNIAGFSKPQSDILDVWG